MLTNFDLPQCQYVCTITQCKQTCTEGNKYICIQICLLNSTFVCIKRKDFVLHITKEDDPCLYHNKFGEIYIIKE